MRFSRLAYLRARHVACRMLVLSTFLVPGRAIAARVEKQTPVDTRAKSPAKPVQNADGRMPVSFPNPSSVDSPRSAGVRDGRQIATFDASYSGKRDNYNGECVGFAENARPDLNLNVDRRRYDKAANMAIYARNAGFDVNSTPEVGDVLILPNVQAAEKDKTGKVRVEVTGHAAVVEEIKSGPENGTRVLTIRDSNFNLGHVPGKAHLTYTYNSLDGSVREIKEIKYDSQCCGEDGNAKAKDINDLSRHRNINGAPEYSGAQFIHENSVAADAFYKESGRQPSNRELVDISQKTLEKMYDSVKDFEKRNNGGAPDAGEIAKIRETAIRQSIGPASGAKREPASGNAASPNGPANAEKSQPASTAKAELSARVAAAIRGLPVPEDLRQSQGLLDSIRKNLVRNSADGSAYAALLAAEEKERGAALQSLHAALVAANAGDIGRSEALLAQAQRFEVSMGQQGALAARVYSGTIVKGYEDFIAKIEAGSDALSVSGGASGAAVGIALSGIAATLKAIVDSETASGGAAAQRFTEDKIEDMAKKIVERVAQQKLPLGKVWETAKIIQDGWTLAGGGDLGEKLAAAVAVAERRLAGDRRSGARTPTDVDLRHEARNENVGDLVSERRIDAFANRDRQADQILDRSAIDAHGNRVRMEGYLLRPTPTQVEHVMLDKREGRLDSVTMLRTYASALADLGQIAVLDRYAQYGSVLPPSNWMKRLDIDATNGIDHLRNLWLMGSPTWQGQLNVISKPSTFEWQLRLSGPGYDVVKEDYQVTNSLLAIRFVDQVPGPGGGLATDYDKTYHLDTRTTTYDVQNLPLYPTWASSQFGGQQVASLRYADGTWVGEGQWWLTNGGTPLSVVACGAATASCNIEQRFTATEFRGRDIDVIFPSTFFQSSSQQGN